MKWWRRNRRLDHPKNDANALRSKASEYLVALGVAQAVVSMVMNAEDAQTKLCHDESGQNHLLQESRSGCELETALQRHVCVAEGPKHHETILEGAGGPDGTVKANGSLNKIDDKCKAYSVWCRWLHPKALCMAVVWTSLAWSSSGAGGTSNKVEMGNASTAVPCIRRPASSCAAQSAHARSSPGLY